jgi:hypothetical protein
MKAKPKQKPKRKAYRRTKAEAAAHRAAQAQGVRYEYEAAPVLKDGARAKGKTAQKKPT